MVEIEHIVPLKMTFSFQYTQASFQVAHHSQSQRALATSRLTNQPNRITLVERQINIAQDWQRVTRTTGIADAEILHLNQWIVRHTLYRCLLGAIDTQSLGQGICTQVDPDN